MNKSLTLLFILVFGCSFLSKNSFAAVTNKLENSNLITKKSSFEAPENDGFFAKRITRKIKKWFNKMEQKLDQPKEDSSDEISTWTLISLGLILGSFLFPPLAFVAVITSIIAMKKNKHEEEFGDLDKVLAITSLILALIISLSLLLIVALFGSVLLLGFLGA